MPILKWLTRDKDIINAGKVENRLLKETPEHGYGDKNSANMLIHGDNLDVLKALLPFYAGQVKCIYIDPPYNTGAAFEHYDDNLEHTTWLSIMYPRLELLRDLLSKDGCIFVQIDDNEYAYLKVMMDEIFGRDNNIGCIAVKMSEASGNKMAHVSKKMIKIKEYILVYKKQSATLNPIKIQKEMWDSEYNKMFLNFSVDDKRFIDSVAAKEKPTAADVAAIDQILSKVNVISIAEGQKRDGINPEDEIAVKEWLFNNSYRIFRTAASSSVKKLADEKRINCANTYFSVLSVRDNLLYVVKSDYAATSSSPRVQILFAEDYLTTYIGDLWTDIPTTGLEAEGGVDFKNSKKPERLIERVLTLASNPGDLVLDSFLGSGTTAAVAHKMGRRWIGVELGNHAYSHCVPRLQKVVDGTDSGGISKGLNWHGGGGFRFYELGNSIFDENGHINSDVTYEQLAAHIWFYETKTPFNKPLQKSIVLGVYNGVAYALLYNDALRCRGVDGNVLTSQTLEIIKEDLGNAEYDKLVIYGDASRLGPGRMRENNIEFKQTPYDIKVK